MIDVNPSSLVAARADGHLVVEGDATTDATRRAAGLERARGLVTVMDSDVGNVYVTLSARNLNPQLFIVARASAEETESKLIQAGADRVASPYTRAGRHMAELAIRPRVADFIDAALSHGEHAFSMEEVMVAEGGSPAGARGQPDRVGRTRAASAPAGALLSVREAPGPTAGPSAPGNAAATVAPCPRHPAAGSSARGEPASVPRDQPRGRRGGLARHP